MLVLQIIFVWRSIVYIQQIINGLKCQVIGVDNPEITSLSCDTSTVKAGSLFFCLKGQQYDGHNFFRKVIGDGAVAIVTEKKLDTSLLQIVVPNCRIAMSVCAKNFYEHCADKMRLIAIVGTNGKTSTSYILQNILQKGGSNTAVVGTNGVFFNNQHLACNLTTPDPILLHKLFKQMYQNNVKTVVMEVSAHAIALSKVYGLHFDVAIFTNFSQDHLDFFHTMERYAEVKRSFFNSNVVTNAVVNVDDKLGEQIYSQLPSVSFGLNNNCDCFIQKVQQQGDCTTFELSLFGSRAIAKTKLKGQFNLYNILSACTASAVLGVPMSTIVDAVSEVEYIDGRNQTLVRSDGAKIVIDFAHTPDGINNILTYLKGITQGQLIVVFGCGGNRDKFKRPLMAEVVSKYADFAVVTNDNPRFEDPKVIADDIVARLSCKYKVVLNRSQATEFALSLANCNDTIAILGKGAERYQEIRSKKIPYSDLDVVSKLLARNT